MEDVDHSKPQTKNHSKNKKRSEKLEKSDDDDEDIVMHHINMTLFQQDISSLTSSALQNASGSLYSPSEIDDHNDIDCITSSEHSNSAMDENEFVNDFSWKRSNPAWTFKRHEMVFVQYDDESPLLIMVYVRQLSPLQHEVQFINDHQHSKKCKVHQNAIIKLNETNWKHEQLETMLINEFNIRCNHLTKNILQRKITQWKKKFNQFRSNSSVFEDFMNMYCQSDSASEANMDDDIQMSDVKLEEYDGRDLLESKYQSDLQQFVLQVGDFIQYVPDNVNLNAHIINGRILEINKYDSNKSLSNQPIPMRLTTDLNPPTWNSQVAKIHSRNQQTMHFVALKCFKLESSAKIIVTKEMQELNQSRKESGRVLASLGLRNRDSNNNNK